MLLLEPATTPEGVLAKRALQEYTALRKNLEDVKSLLSIKAIDEKPFFTFKNGKKKLYK